MELFNQFAALIFPMVFAIGALFFAVWDSRHVDENPDKQIGIKIVLFTFCLLGASIALGGVNTLIHYLMSGAKSAGLKPGVAGFVSGAAIALSLFILFLPRTNHVEDPSIDRMAAGYAAIGAGFIAMVAFSQFATLTISGAKWAEISVPLSELIVYGAAFVFVLMKLGDMSGWTKPVAAPKVTSNASYPQQQPMQGYPPQGGMPPQGGGYPPQGGMPPQGGGYPPQGGMPPQGSGYPPQGGMPPQGGGYPPQGGGGYPPR